MKRNHFLFVVLLSLIFLSRSSNAQVGQRPRAHSSLNGKLMDAIYRNDTNRVLSCLAQGADPNAHKRLKAFPHQPAFSISALLMALDFRWREVAHQGHFWFDGYIPANAPPENTTIVRALLDKGAKLDVRNEIGLTPLHIAAWQGKAATVELLLHYGAKVNALGTGSDFRAVKSTPLILAASDGNIATIKVLVRHGADIDTIRDHEGYDALMIAKAHQNAQAVAIMEAALKKSSKARKS